MTEPTNVVSVLNADCDEFDRILATLDPAQWTVPTPAEGWTVAHQVAHLAATYRLAALAAGDPAAFEAVVGHLGPDFNANVRRAMADFLKEPPEVLLDRWHAERRRCAKALDALAPDTIVPWLVRPLPAAVLAAAGVMELFAHGQDVMDGLGLTRQFTDRIRVIVGFAVRTWDFGYLGRGVEVPDVQLRFELTAPSGALWEFGPAGSPERITGPAADFCLLVTRRRHRADLLLTAEGAEADRWLDIAQAYRGPAGAGRRPGQFAGA